jgi:hypothetical protein
VRGLKVQKHVHKPVDVSLTLTSKDITVCAIQETWLDCNRHRHDSRVQLCRTAGTQLRLDPWRNRVPDQTRCHGLLRAAALAKFDQATWVRLKSKSRQNSLVLVSAYVRPISPTRSQAEFADDLSLTVDIEHWQQKNTVVVCGDFNARIGRQGAESPTNSVVPQFETRDAQGATLVDLMNTTGLYSLANRKGPETRYTYPHSGAVGGRLPHGSSELLKFTTSRALHRGR